jgi:hypothetical protein
MVVRLARSRPIEPVTVVGLEVAVVGREVTVVGLEVMVVDLEVMVVSLEVMVVGRLLLIRVHHRISDRPVN